MRKLNRMTLAACLLSAAMTMPASAAILSADFFVSLDLPQNNGNMGPREFEALNTLLGAGNELDDGDETQNPSGYSGSVFVDLSETGLVTLTGDQPLGFADYDVAIITITGIVFDAGETITGVASLLTGLLDPTFGVGQIAPVLSFTSNSISILFDTSGAGNSSDFEFLDGGQSTFQLAFGGPLPPVPLPAGLPLLAAGLGALALARRKRRT